MHQDELNQIVLHCGIEVIFFDSLQSVVSYRLLATVDSKLCLCSVSDWFLVRFHCHHF